MTKVEEAREVLIGGLTEPLSESALARAIVATEHLISAAREAGFEEGKEEGKAMDIETLAVAYKGVLAKAHAEGVAEGAEEALARIREAARPLLVSRGGALEVVSIPASVLTPKETP